MISLLCPVCGNPVDVAIDGGCTKECDDIFHGIEQTEENKMTNKDALEALDDIAKRIKSLDGMYDWVADIQTIRQALEVNQELVVALRAISTLKDMAESVVGMVDYPYIKALEQSVFLAKQAIAKAEGKE